MNKLGKVVVAMSGGVDSSVAAALLLRQGYDVMGVFMRLGTPAGVQASDTDTCDPAGHRGCCSVRDADDARQVAGLLDIPFYVANFQEDFGRVIDYFVAEYNAGRTPNPCVRCNDWLKFGKLTAYANAVGADYVATGHYARIGRDPATGQHILMRGRDTRKDQSYVLFGITPANLQHTLFPIGELDKPQVRAMAEEIKLPVFDKPDSQDICFVPDGDYAALVNRRSPGALRPGHFIDTQGKRLGEHPGHQHFTIGQRKGLGIALGARAYVVDINPATNDVTLGEKSDLLRPGFVAGEINITHPGVQVDTDITCQVKVRYNQPPQPAVMRISAGKMHVRFEEPIPAITPGQAAVAFSGDNLLCGGWIEHPTPNTPTT